MGLLPSQEDIEQAAEKAEDHLVAALDGLRLRLIADIERILDERQIRVTFEKKA